MNEIIKAMFTILMLVEDSSTDNLKEHAIGVYQIRPIFVKDVNLISKHEVFSHEDARNARKAQQMIFIYLTYWGNKYEEKTGYRVDAETLGRIINGGPNGWKKSSTREYGERCKNLYEQWKLENE
jgi:hypothetical protein